MNRLVSTVIGGALVLLGGACGAPQQTAPHAPSPAFGDAAALSSLIDAPAATARERLLTSWALEAAGRHDEARALLEPAELFGDPALALARSVRAYALAWDLLDPAAATPLDAATAALDAEDVFIAAAEEVARYSRFARSFGQPPTDWPVWRVVGPFSHVSTVDFDAPFAPDTDVMLADRYAMPSIALRTRAMLDDPDGITIPAPAGVWYAETGFEIDRPSEVLIASSTSAAIRVFVDDVEATRVTPDQAYGSQLRIARVQLEAGSHRLRVRVSSRQASHVWTRVIVPEGVALRYESARTIGEASLAEPGAAPQIGGSTGDVTVDWLAHAELATLSGDGLAAIWLLEAAWPSTSPLGALWLARLADSAWTIPSDERDEIAVGALEAAEPWSRGATVSLERARRYLDHERHDDARTLLADLLIGHAENRAVQTVAADLYDYEGFSEIAESHLRSAVAIGAPDCGLIGRLIGRMTARGEPVELDGLPADWAGCDDVIEAHIESALLPRGEHERATELALALLVRSPSDRGLFELVHDLALTSGDDETAAAAREMAELYRFEDVDSAALDVDLATRAGDEPGTAIAALFEAAPARIESQLLASLLDVDDVLDDLRVDGLQAVRDYQAAGEPYQGNVVYVLDYGATRYFEDGSAISVIHQIIQLRTRDALGGYGETGVPQNALLLTARTIKPDGSVLVPESLQGTSAISMPNLEVGDFIELEWVERTWQPGSGFRGVRSPRFFFRVGDGPLHLSTARYDRPESWAGDEIFDVRNFDGERSDQRADGVSSTIFTLRASMPPSPDDGAADSAEWLPSVRYSYDYPAEEVVRYYSDRVANETVLTPSLIELAESLTAGLGERDAARAVFRYVVDEIDDAGTFFGQPAAWAPVLGVGDRLALSWALLTAVGLEPQLVFVRPLGNDATETAIVDDTAYDLTAIRVFADGDAVWLEPEFDHYPFDYLRTDAQGCAGWIVAGPEAGSRIITPRWPDVDEVSNITIDILLDVAGDATVVVSEHVPRASASGLRSYLEAVDDRSMIERALENAMSSSFPAVTLSGFEVEGELEPDAPLSLVYRFESRGFADVIGETYVIDDAVFARPLAARYATWPARERELLVAYGVREVVTIRVRGPEGAEVIELPEAFSLTERNNTYVITYEDDGGALVVTRTIDVAPQRVSVADYPAFAQFLLEMQPSMRLRAVLGTH